MVRSALVALRDRPDAAGLADHDGDVDAAVEMLGRGANPKYGAMLERLDPEDVAFRYLEEGRPDDALTMLRALFVREPGAAAYTLLLGWALRVGEQEAQRDRALVRTRALGARVGNGTLLVELALGEGDLETAWEMADDLGAGHAWPALAAATADSDPARAAEHRSQLHDALGHADKRSYRTVAATLQTMRRLYAAAGTGAVDALDAEIREIRTTYKRRPGLLGRTRPGQAAALNGPLASSSCLSHPESSTRSSPAGRREP